MSQLLKLLVIPLEVIANIIWLIASSKTMPITTVSIIKSLSPGSRKEKVPIAYAAPLTDTETAHRKSQNPLGIMG